MANTQKEENANKITLVSTAVRDMVVLIVVTIFVFILSYFFDMFAVIVRFLRTHPEDVVYADEIITILLTLSVGLAVFAWRRWMELKIETAERIKKDEELIRISSTQADIERIISKQLRMDMEQMKDDVRQILYAISKERKGKD